MSPRARTVVFALSFVFGLVAGFTGERHATTSPRRMA